MSAIGAPFDLTLDFGHKHGDADPNYIVRVSMSWEHAVSMLALLQRLVGEFQEKVGPIPNAEAAGLATTTSEEGP